MSDGSAVDCQHLAPTTVTIALCWLAVSASVGSESHVASEVPVAFELRSQRTVSLTMPENSATRGEFLAASSGCIGHFGAVSVMRLDPACTDRLLAMLGE